MLERTSTRLSVGPINGWKVSVVAVDHELGRHLAGLLVEADAGHLADACVGRIEHVVLEVDARLRRREAHLQLLQRPERRRPR